MARPILKTSIKEFELYRNRDNDISHWTDLGMEGGGTRDKKILLRPNTNQQFLTKFPKYGDFEITTEIFNGILGKELGLPHVQYFPIIFQGRRGVTCRTFLKQTERIEELWEMKDLICRHFKQTNLEEKFGRDDEVIRLHNLDNIYLILDTEFGMGVLPKFFQMLGFDALIGHGDRHWANYGVVVNFTDNMSSEFAPLYDTASGYLTEIDIATQRKKLLEYLGDKLKDPKWYTAKSKKLCKIKLQNDIKCNHFDLLEYVIANKPFSMYKRHLSLAFRNFDETLPKRILSKFFDKIDPVHKDVIDTILNERYRIGSKLF